MKNDEIIHFIGIGGVSMSSLAAIAKKNGAVVTGSDRNETPVTKKLEEEGIKIFYPQKAENIGNAEKVVFTAAIPDDNPEIVRAKELGIPLVRRSEYLGGLMKGYPCRIGVSGTHGKSSTTGMLSSIFMLAGKDPTVVCGAELPELDGAYRLGAGEQFIYEACEYKDSFLDFFPSVCVMLNMEMDHVDYFKSMEQMENSYTRSAENAGAVVANWDSPHVRSAAGKVKGAWLVKVGIDSEDVDYRAINITFDRGCASFDLMKENEKLARITLKVPGRHHVSNALCAAAAAHICGIDGEEIAHGLACYSGVRRRFEYRGEYTGARIYDDYAHHPTEIEATLKTAREVLDGKGRLFVAFQPHTYSRTAGLFEDFVSSLSLCDKLYLAPIYAAREENVYGVTSDMLAEKIPNAETGKTFEEIAEKLAGELKEGDMLLTMGAGNACRVGEILRKK